jgi:hypothetical protein
MHNADVYGFGWHFLDGRSFQCTLSDKPTIMHELHLLTERDYSTANYMLYRKCYSTFDSLSPPPCFLWMATDLHTFMKELDAL